MAKKSAKVTLDAGTTAKLEKTLRDALVGAACANRVEDLSKPKPASASVELDPATVARFTEHLRSGLVSAAAANRAEQEAADKATKKVR